jgi:hypothetical protein
MTPRESCRREGRQPEGQGRARQGSLGSFPQPLCALNLDEALVRPVVGHTGHVTTPHYEATLRAVARLDFAVQMLTDTEHPEPRAPGWTAALTSQLTAGMQACRWFLATGFTPSEQFGPWLRGCLAAHDLVHSDIYGSVVWSAADAVDRLREEWRPEWSM